METTDGNVTFESDDETGFLLYGTFYPHYDIPFIIIWLLIITFGIGNWMLFWLFLKTKALRTPFNALVLALAFSNGLATNVVGPMEVSRAFVLYRPVSLNWCKAKVFIKTFCFSVSLLVIVMLSVLRFHAGIQIYKMRLTFKKVFALIASVYVIALASAPLLLDPTSSTMKLCMGTPDLIYTKKLTTGEIGARFSYGQYGNNNDGVTMLATTSDIAQILDRATSASSLLRSNDSHKSNSSDFDPATSENNTETKRLWVFYFYATLLLFGATLTFYLMLVIVLKKRQTKIGDVVIGNKRDILTLRVAAFVSLSFFFCYLLPFVPALFPVEQQTTAVVLHYIALYGCLSSIEGALQPIIYILSNKIYRKAFLHLIRRSINQITPGSNTIQNTPSMNKATDTPNPRTNQIGAIQAQGTSSGEVIINPSFLAGPTRSSLEIPGRQPPHVEHSAPEKHL